MIGYRVPRPSWLDDVLLEAVQVAYDAGEVAPPAYHDLAAALGVPPCRVQRARAYLVKTGRLVRVRNGVPADEANDPPPPSPAEIRRACRELRASWPPWRLGQGRGLFVYADPRRTFDEARGRSA